jgi:hypothetical protein
MGSGTVSVASGLHGDRPISQFKISATGRCIINFGVRLARMVVQSLGTRAPVVPTGNNGWAGELTALRFPGRARPLSSPQRLSGRRPPEARVLVFSGTSASSSLPALLRSGSSVGAGSMAKDLVPTRR